MKYALLLISYLLLTSFIKDAPQCGDLLDQYLEVPPKTSFLECNEGQGQVILEAKYLVSGENSKEIEQFLVHNYGIGKLKFTCCGWESINGQNGYVENEQLKKINSNFILEISMFGNAEKKDEKGKYYLETDRDKIDFFVTIKVLDV